MGIFGQSTSFDADLVEKATSATNTNENWSLFMDVCDKVTTNPRCAKDCLKAIMKRMAHPDPHVVMQAITLLDACANNCGKPFHLEIASRDFENDYCRLLKSAQPKISLKMRQVLKNWAQNDFKNDPELGLIPALVSKLRLEGYDFTNLDDKPAKSASKLAAALKDPNVVSSQQEEDDIAKAIELSLKESKNSPKKQTSVNATSAGSSAAASAYPSLYPTFSSTTPASLTATASGNTTANITNSAPTEAPPEPRRVRALYDFEAAEENELTFLAGEIVHVIDDIDPNWWKGYNQRGEGLFPSNFVTADLSVEPERFDINQQNKSDQIKGDDLGSKDSHAKTDAGAIAAENQPIEIDEIKIDRLLHLLHEANPEDPSQDTDEMRCLEQEVHHMGPLIDAELERVDRKHAQLTQLSVDLVDAINLYHSLMRDDRTAGSISVLGGGGFMPGPGINFGMTGYQPNSHTLYNAAGYSGAAAAAAVGGGRFPLMQQSNYSAASNYASAIQMMPNNPQIPSVANVPGSEQDAGSIYTAAPQLPSQQMIRMQYQNGSANPGQLGGAGVLAPSISSSLPSQQLYAGATAQHLYQQAGTHQQQNYPMILPQQQQQQQQQLQQSHLQQMQASATIDQQQLIQPPPASSQQQHQFLNHQQSSSFAHPQQQQQQNHHHQQQQQQPQQQQPQPQFMPMPNNSSFILSSAHPRNNNNNNTINNATAHFHEQQQQEQQLQHLNHSQQSNIDLNQLQHQMAMMAMAANSSGTTTAASNTAGAAAVLNHPAAAQNFLMKNETQNNIPIYQQQR